MHDVTDLDFKTRLEFSEHCLMLENRFYFGAEINTNTANFQLSAKSEI